MLFWLPLDACAFPLELLVDNSLTLANRELDPLDENIFKDFTRWIFLLLLTLPLEKFQLEVGKPV